MTEDFSDINYVVATIKKWNIQAFHQHTQDIPGKWHLITDPRALTIERLEHINPRYIFFPHWSWIVPKDILQVFECVCFHMTDVPYGRGGSPLQNLIIRGHTQTKLTALRMVEDLDAGPVYGKLPLCLEGRADDIYYRVSDLCYELVRSIVHQRSTPEPQIGEVVCFPRRKPEQSELPKEGELDKLYDHIRMLDAESYPKAFIEYGNHFLEFSHAELIDGRLEAKVTLTKKTQ